MSTGGNESIKIGKKLKVLREFKELNQEFIAQELDLSVSGYSRIERDDVKISLDKLVILCRVLEINIDNLIYCNDDEILAMQNAPSIFNKVNNENLQKLETIYNNQILHLKEEILYLRELLKKKL